MKTKLKALLWAVAFVAWPGFAPKVSELAVEPWRPLANGVFIMAWLAGMLALLVVLFPRTFERRW